MDLTLKNRSRANQEPRSESPPPKQQKLHVDESDDSSDSDTCLLVEQSTADEEQHLWEDEEWVRNLHLDDSGLTLNIEESGEQISSTPVTSPNKQTPAETPNPLVQPKIISSEATKKALVLDYLAKIIAQMEEFGKEIQANNIDDLWAYSIENRCNIEALCEAIKVDKADFTDLDNIISLFEKLKRRSNKEKLTENKKLIPDAKQQVSKLKEVLIDIYSPTSLLKKHQITQINKPVSTLNAEDSSYEPYRANSIVIQPKFGSPLLPIWVTDYVKGLKDQIIATDSYFDTGLRVYFKSIEAAKDNFNKMISNEKLTKEDIYIGRPSRGGNDKKWEDLQFEARIKVITSDFTAAWYTKEDNNPTLRKEDFLKFFFESNNFLTKSDWVYLKTKDSTSISTIYFVVALRTFDALKKYDSRNSLFLSIIPNKPKERVLGVYHPILCFACLKHGHYYYDCKNPSRCPLCSSIPHSDSPCKKSNTCPHCLRTYPPELKHSPSDYNCPAYQEKGYQLQKAVKTYKGGY